MAMLIDIGSKKNMKSKIEEAELTNNRNNCRSIRFTSAKGKQLAYRAQCRFLGDESFKVLADSINAARNTRWQAQ
jgi:hypothetical protein